VAALNFSLKKLTSAASYSCAVLAEPKKVNLTSQPNFTKHSGSGVPLRGSTPKGQPWLRLLENWASPPQQFIQKFA
jgi:hypothetical protein